MKLVKSFIIAFSMYSKIPMPQFSWEEEDMGYVLCFFPLVGAAAGILVAAWARICKLAGIGTAACVLFGTALPLILTGGFHVDGFMDTMDALHSYQSRERKLEILKDPHIGAFSVIMLFLYYLVYGAAFSEIRGERALLTAAAGFVLSRILSGIGAVTLPPARKNGLLKTVTDRAEKRQVLFILLLQLMLCAGGMLALSKIAGFLALLGAFGSFLYYRRLVLREFGGVTGDTAGYFLLLCEAAVMVMTAVGSHF